MILNGDTFFPIDYALFNSYHDVHMADISISLREIQDVSQSGHVLKGENHRILSFNEKINEKTAGLINGGAYIFNKNILERFNLPEAFSIEKDFFEKHIDRVKAHGFVFDDYFIDIGTPENYLKAQSDLT